MSPEPQNAVPNMLSPDTLSQQAVCPTTLSPYMFFPTHCAANTVTQHHGPKMLYLQHAVPYMADLHTPESQHA